MTNRSMGLTPDIHDYICKISVRNHPVLEALRAQTQKMPERKMQIAPEQGQFLSFMVKALNVKTILEIGVYTGYSSLCMAMSLPLDGHITCIDANPEWTKIAQKHWALANVSDKITFHLSKADTILHDLLNKKKTFDLIFIDADKKSYPLYFEAGLKLLNPNGVLLLDNVLINGRVADQEQVNDNITILRDLNLAIHANQDLDICLLPLGDGLTMIRKK